MAACVEEPPPPPPVNDYPFYEYKYHQSNAQMSTGTHTTAGPQQQSTSNKDNQEIQIYQTQTHGGTDVNDHRLQIKLQVGNHNFFGKKYHNLSVPLSFAFFVNFTQKHFLLRI